MKEVKNIIKLIAVLLPLTLAVGVVAVFALNPSAIIGNYIQSIYVDSDSVDGGDTDVVEENKSGSLILASTFGKTTIVEKEENSDVDAMVALCDVSGELLEHDFEYGRCTVCGEEEASLEISAFVEQVDENENIYKEYEN